MALFGSSEKKIITSKKIRPIDFNILKVQAYTRLNDGTKELDK